MKNKILVLLLLIVCLTGCSCKKKETKKVEDNNVEEKNEINNEVKEPEKKKLQIIDENSNSRPIAVMINNHPQAVPNHAGLQDAYVTYEILVEGGLTRMMAVFKDRNPEKIGSVRSSRPYFLDYVLENDAIYTHFGYSDQAKSDIGTLGINNINGLLDDGFWRDTSLNVDYEHTAFISMDSILNVARNKGYRMESNNGNLLNYTTDEVNLNEKDGNIVANTVNVRYSDFQLSSYIYDQNNKVYLRFINGNPHTDGLTHQQYSYKNILVVRVGVYSDDGYYQKLNNTGSGDGYYITNGYAIPIKWEKSSREAKTIYKDLSGNLISINDGNTFIQIQPNYEDISMY